MKIVEFMLAREKLGEGASEPLYNFIYVLDQSHCIVSLHNYLEQKLGNQARGTLSG